MLGQDKEIEEIKAMVARHFPVYEVRVRPEVLSFFVHIEPATLDANFDSMRKEMIPKGYIPYVTRDKGEHLVLVQRRPQTRFLGTQVNFAMLVLTIFTTVFAGAVQWAAYEGLPLFDARSLAFGALFFALPLMAILGIHEMGHYITAKKYKVAASLPFFVPSIPPLGTFGAVISMRDPIPSRKALLDIGISGPLYGLAVAIPVTLLGLFLINNDPKPVTIMAGDAVALPSFLYDMLALLIPVPANVKFHPMAFAGWVGMFVTALNLLPAGQLDGGHVARAVLGDRARYLSYFAIFTMVFLSFFYQGWLIIALFILFLGARHPPPLNDITKLTVSRKAVGALAVIVFLATFIPTPMALVEENPDFSFVAATPYTVNVTTHTNVTAYFAIANVGNAFANITVDLRYVDTLKALGIEVKFLNYTGQGFDKTVLADNFTVELMPDQSVNVTFFVDATNYVGSPTTFPNAFGIRGDMLYGPTKELSVNVNVL